MNSLLVFVFVFLLLLATAIASISRVEQEKAGEDIELRAPSPPRIEFTVTFKAEGATERVYRDFIVEIRGRLINTAPAPRNVRGVVVAREIDRWNPRWFAVILQTNTEQATLYLRADTLYFDGYQDGKQRLFELNHYNQAGYTERLWAGSTFMGFGVTYRQFGNNGGPLIGTPYGPWEMVNAINRLGRGEHTGRAVVTLVVMVCEAVRFNPVFNEIANLYRDSQTATAPALWGDLVVSWSQLSRGLLLDSIRRTFNFSVFAEFNVHTAGEAAAILGLLLNPRGDWRPGCHRNNNDLPHLLTSINITDDGVGDEDICLPGVPMLEVFKVVVTDIDKENPGDLYGTITVNDGLNTHYIFNRERKNYQSIRPYEEAILTGPRQHAIRAFTDFTISLDLWDKDADASPDDEVAKGDIGWSLANDYSNEYDEVLQKIVNGRYGSVLVSYAVFQATVQATIHVQLIDGDGEDPADIYGKVAARNSFSGSTDSVLFSKRDNEDVPVRPGNYIPLERSVVAVPINKNARLIVDVDLWDRDRDWSSNDEVAKGTVDLTPHTSGEHERYVYGRYGSVKLVVKWSIPPV